MVGPAPSHRRRWSNLVPICVALIVIVEIASLGRLDMAEKAAAVEHYWTTSFYFPSTTTAAGGGGGSDAISSETPSLPIPLDADEEGDRNCEKWLEREDAVDYERDFSQHPVIVSGVDQDWRSCSVGCKFGDAGDKVADASFGLPQDPAVFSILRSMESSHYYAENNIDLARRRGYKIIMTTSLSSDVPVGYFSWAEYDIMAPLHPKTEEALAAAFISNCGARNFRLQALERLEKLDIKIDSYGSCHRNRDGKVDKVEALKRYKFSLAFENSNEEDYVTEKFFQSLVAGTVPIVVGAPNIQDFAPSPGSILHIKELKDVDSVAKTMRHLAENPDAFNKSLSWKFEGPSDSFKALVDMAAVHSSCRLCIHIATKIQEKEEKAPKFQNRPCKCTDGSETVYHLYVRERGRFKTENIYLRSSKLSVGGLNSAVLEKFKSVNHEPVWKKERPESIRGGDELKIHRIYPVGLTQRQALYNFMFSDDVELKKFIESNPCAKLEVIFV